MSTPIPSATYDPAGRLTGETRTGNQPYTLAYAYDKAGNRTQQTRDGTTTLWLVDAANRLTTIRRQGVPESVKVTVRGKTDDPTARITVAGIGTWPNSAKEWSQEISLGEADKEITVSAQDQLGNQRDQKIPIKVVDPTKREFTHDPNGNLTHERLGAFSWRGHRRPAGPGDSDRHLLPPLRRFRQRAVAELAELVPGTRGTLTRVNRGRFLRGHFTDNS